MPTTVQTTQEQFTTLSPEEVLANARNFFARRNGIYSTFLEREGPSFVTFRGQGGEEVVIGVAKSDAGTRVTGSSYLFDMQIARFLSTLPPAASSDVPLRAGESVAPAAQKS
jgi:hypothetical protein